MTAQDYTHRDCDSAHTIADPLCSRGDTTLIRPACRAITRAVYWQSTQSVHPITAHARCVGRMPKREKSTTGANRPRVPGCSRMTERRRAERLIVRRAERLMFTAHGHHHHADHHHDRTP